MMRTALSTFLQFGLFLITFLAGSFLRPFHLQTILASDTAHTRIFIWDGLLLMLVLYLLVLVLEATLNKLPRAALPSTIAVLLAAILGLIMKFGFVITDS